MNFKPVDLKLLQEQFLQSGGKDTKFYEACIDICRHLFKKEFDRTGYRPNLTKSDLEEMSHDAATRFLSLYWKDPEYRYDGSIYHRLKFEITFALYNNKKKSKDEWEQEFSEELEATIPAPEKEVYIDYDMTDKEMYYLSTSNTFKMALRKLVQGLSKSNQYYIDRLSKYTEVWKTFHPGKETV